MTIGNRTTNFLPEAGLVAAMCSSHVVSCPGCESHTKGANVSVATQREQLERLREHRNSPVGVTRWKRPPGQGDDGDPRFDAKLSFHDAETGEHLFTMPEGVVPPRSGEHWGW